MPMLASALCAMASDWPAWAESASHEFFERKIRPVLSEHCFECHSASAKKLKGGLRVDGLKELLPSYEIVEQSAGYVHWVVR